MKINEYKERTVIQTVRKGLKCDICGKETTNPDDPNFAHIEASWEDDGDRDRFEYDVCSLDCYMKQLKDLVERSEKFWVYDIDGKTAEFVKSMVKDYEAKCK